MMRVNIEGVIGEISSLPGCSQVAVSHAVFIPEENRGKGVGSTANARRKALVFDELGYDVMMCTVDAANAAQIKILTKNGWTFIYGFTSSKTGHQVQIWACQP